MGDIAERERRGDTAIRRGRIGFGDRRTDDARAVVRPARHARRGRDRDSPGDAVHGRSLVAGRHAAAQPLPG